MAGSTPNLTTTVVENGTVVAHDAFDFMRDADPMVVYSFLAAATLVAVLLIAAIFFLKKRQETVPLSALGDTVPLKAFMHVTEEQARQYESLRTAMMESNECMMTLSTAVAGLTAQMNVFSDLMTQFNHPGRRSTDPAGQRTLFPAE